MPNNSGSLALSDDLTKLIKAFNKEEDGKRLTYLDLIEEEFNGYRSSIEGFRIRTKTWMQNRVKEELEL